MSLSVEGQKCPVCKAYLFDDEDIVFCPTCGAPHHRDCYMKLGHCALEELHGTPEQYDANKFAEEKKAAEEPKEESAGNAAYRCIRCGTELSENDMFCPVCRTPRMQQGAGFGGGAHINFGFNQTKWKGDTVIEDDVTLNDVAPLVAANIGRYSEKFIMLNKKHRSSWNWVAFLFPSAWSFYRKNYVSGVLFGILQVASALLTLPAQLLMRGGTLADSATWRDMLELLLANKSTMWLALAGALLGLAVSIFAGAFADYIYRGNCIEKAKKIKAAPDGERERLRYKLGGISPLWFLIALMAENYLPMIIAMFL